MNAAVFTHEARTTLITRTRVRSTYTSAARATIEERGHVVMSRERLTLSRIATRENFLIISRAD